MKNFILCFVLLWFLAQKTFSQEYIMAVQKPYIVLMDAETGDITDSQFIDLSSLDTSTSKGVLQVGHEIWISDQINDVIYKFDLEGDYLESISGGLDNIKGMAIVNESEVWVTNAGAQNGAPGDAIVRFDFEGNNLGHFSTQSKSAFGIVDNKNGEVYFTYTGTNPVESREYSGDIIGNLTAVSLNFPQQLWITEDNNLLVATFSSPSGVYLFDLEDGSQLDYWSETGARGVIETGDGSVLWSSSAGIHRLDPSSGDSTLLAGGAAQFFALLNLSENDGCVTPELVVENPDPVCAGEEISISVSSSGEEIWWYDSQDAEDAIHEGATFIVSDLQETTSYWVKAVSYGSSGEGEQITGGARVSPVSNDGTQINPNTAPWGLSFETEEDFILHSVEVHLTSDGGDLVVQLLDENWDFLEETTVSVPSGSSSNPTVFEVPLDFEVEADKTYRLVAVSGPEMIREFSSGHSGYPYPIGEVGSVTGGTINNSDSNSTVYYFFYNWTVSTETTEKCESDLEEVVFTINPIPEAPTAEDEQFLETGDTLADLEVDAEGDLIWYEDEEGTIILPEETELEDGVIYYVSQISEGCESELTAITVYILMSVNNFENNLVKVYPNPVKDILRMDAQNQVDQIEIYDLNGKKLNAIEHSEIDTIDFSAYASGIYIIKITSGKQIQTIKLIKD